MSIVSGRRAMPRVHVPRRGGFGRFAQPWPRLPRTDKRLRAVRRAQRSLEQAHRQTPPVKDTKKRDALAQNASRHIEPFVRMTAAQTHALHGGGHVCILDAADECAHHYVNVLVAMRVRAQHLSLCGQRLTLRTLLLLRVGQPRTRHANRRLSQHCHVPPHIGIAHCQQSIAFRRFIV